MTKLEALKLSVGELSRLIQLYDQAHYSKGITLVPDEEYDILMRVYEDKRRSSMENADLKYHNKPINQKIRTEDHSCLTPIIRETHKFKDIKSFVSNLLETSPKLKLAWLPKIEGVNFQADFRGGKLLRILVDDTKPDGTNITDAVQQVCIFPDTLSLPIDIIVRGTLYVTRDTIKKICPGGESHHVVYRLLVEPTTCTGVKYLINGVSLASDNILNSSYTKQLDYVTDLGLRTVKYGLVSDSYTFDEIILDDIKSKPYIGNSSTPVIGITFIANDISTVIANTTGSRVIKYAKTLRVRYDNVVAPIAGEYFSITRDGRLIPVILFNKVKVGPVTVHKKWLSSFKERRELSAFIGNQVSMTYSSITGLNIKPVLNTSHRTEDTPDICPYCDNDVTISNGEAYCSAGTDCRGAIRVYLARAFSRNGMNVPQLNKSVLLELMNIFGVTKLLDVYRLTKDDFSIIYNLNTVSHICESLQQSLRVGPSNLSFAFGVDYQTAREVTDYPSMLSLLREIGGEQLANEAQEFIAFIEGVPK